MAHVPIKPDVLVGHKLAGLTLIRWVDSNKTCDWYEATEDAGSKRLVYLFRDPLLRDRARTRLHGFRTTTDETIQLMGAAPFQAHLIVGDHRKMMARNLRPTPYGRADNAAGDTWF